MPKFHKCLQQLYLEKALFCTKICKEIFWAISFHLDNWVFLKHIHCFPLVHPKHFHLLKNKFRSLMTKSKTCIFYPLDMSSGKHIQIWCSVGCYNHVFLKWNFYPCNLEKFFLLEDVYKFLRNSYACSKKWSTYFNKLDLVDLVWLVLSYFVSNKMPAHKKFKNFVINILKRV